MSLQAFTYPFPETRFLHTGSRVYKFKIRYGSSIRGEEIVDKKIINQELEDSIRAVLGNLDNLQPFTTDHFIIFPYKSKWERVSHLRFKHGEALLDPYPFVCTLYVEMKWLPTGTPRGDNDLERADEEETTQGRMVVKRRKLTGCSFPTGREQGRDIRGTSGRKKPPTHTRKNWPGETAAEEEATGDSDIAFLKHRGDPTGSKSSLVDPKVCLPQPSTPPSSEGSPKKEHAGFFGFLSSLFPFSLFSRKGSQ